MFPSIPISLTTEGVQFKNLASSILFQIDKEINQISGNGKQVFKPIKISSPHAFSSPTLLDLIDVFEKKHEILGFKVNSLRVDQAANSLIEGDCDFLLAADDLTLMQPPFQSICIGK